MDVPERKSPVGRFLAAAWLGLKGAAGTIWSLVRVIVPMTFLVALLEWCGFIAIVAGICEPFMRFFGLSGESLLVFLGSIFFNVYGALAIASSLSLNLREATILAVMCLTAHNLISETAAMKKTGSSAVKMTLLRLGAALAAAWLFDKILPRWSASRPFMSASPYIKIPFASMVGTWALSISKFLAIIAAVVVIIMIAQRVMEEFKLLRFLSAIVAPFMKFLGLTADSSFHWIVINIMGYSYGAGLVAGEIESGRMKPQDGDLFNHHAAMCHSLVEDTALFAIFGISLFWLTVPRLIMAFVVVWFERIRRHYFRRSFRAGVA